jgi:hypothetical protein
MMKGPDSNDESGESNKIIGDDEDNEIGEEGDEQSEGVEEFFKYLDLRSCAHKNSVVIQRLHRNPEAPEKC